MGEIKNMKNKSVSNDPVNHPSHYCDGGIECIDYILAKKMDFLLGQVCKYISRAGKKDPAKEAEDLKKAEFYLKRKIEELENAPLTLSGTESASGEAWNSWEGREGKKSENTCEPSEEPIDHQKSYSMFFGLVKSLGMEWALEENSDYKVRWLKSCGWVVKKTDGDIVDERGELYMAIRNLAAVMFAYTRFRFEWFSQENLFEKTELKEWYTEEEPCHAD